MKIKIGKPQHEPHLFYYSQPDRIEYGQSAHGNSLDSTSVFFDNAIIQAASATVHVDNSFGALTIVFI